MKDKMMDVTQLVVPAKTEVREPSRSERPEPSRGGFAEALSGAENLQDEAARAHKVRSERSGHKSRSLDRDGSASDDVERSGEAGPEAGGEVEGDAATKTGDGSAPADGNEVEGDQNTDTSEPDPTAGSGENGDDAAGEPSAGEQAAQQSGTALAAQAAAAAQAALAAAGEAEVAAEAGTGKVTGQAGAGAAAKAPQVAGMQPDADAAVDVDAATNQRPVELRPTVSGTGGTDAENAEVDPAGDTQLRQMSAGSAKSDGTAGPASTRSGSTSGEAAKAAETAAVVASASRPAGPQSGQATQAAAADQGGDAPDVRLPGSASASNGSTTMGGNGQQDAGATQAQPQAAGPQQSGEQPAAAARPQQAAPQPAASQAQPSQAPAVDANGMPVAAGSEGSSAAERLGLQTVRELARAGQPQTRLEHIAEQLAARLRLSQAAGGSQVHLTMRPRELGDVQVQLAVKDGTLAAVVMADRAETGRMLQQDAGELRRMLEGLGLKVDQLDVHVRGDGAGAGTGSGAANGQDAAPAFRSIPGGADTNVDGLDVASDGAAAPEPQPDEVHDGDVSLLA